MEEFKRHTKIIVYVFLLRGRLDMDPDEWDGMVKSWHNIRDRYSWFMEPAKGHHLGLAFQGVLDTRDERVVKRFMNECYGIAQGDFIGVWTYGSLWREANVGTSGQKDFVGVGRYFDKRVSQGKSGIYPWDNGDIGF